MKIGVFIILVLAVSSCSRPNEDIKKKIANADSLAINYFKGDGTMDTVVATKIIHDQEQLSLLTNLVAARAVEANKRCGYDGSLHFFKMNKVIQDVNFRMNQADCMYFYFVLNGKPGITALPQEAKELINSFRK